MARNKKELQGYKYKPCSGSDQLARHMLCRRLQHVSPLNKPMANTAVTDFCRFHRFLSQKYLHICTYRHQHQHLSRAPSPLEPGTHTSSKFRLLNYTNAILQSRLLQLTPTTVYMLRDNQSVPLHAISSHC